MRLTQYYGRVPQRAGFTLVEIAVVLAIVGVLMSFGVSILTAQMTRSAYSATTEKQVAIKTALTTYLGANRRLPCPDTDLDGLENRPAGTCASMTGASFFGVVPYATLGLTRDSVLDAWQGYFGYAVSGIAGQDWTKQSVTTEMRGGLKVDTRVNSSAGSTTVHDPSGNTGAAAVIISYGQNGLGARTVAGSNNVQPTGSDEFQNALPATPLFFTRDYTEEAGVSGMFDDVVLPITAQDFFAPLLKAGSLRTTAAILQEAFESAERELIGRTVATRTVNTDTTITTPVSFNVGGTTYSGTQTQRDIRYDYVLRGPLTTFNDPWGNPVVYEPLEGHPPPPIPPGPADPKARLYRHDDPSDNAAKAFCLRSWGPNGIANPAGPCATSGDDIVRFMTVGAVKGMLSKSGL